MTYSLTCSRALAYLVVLVAVCTSDVSAQVRVFHDSHAPGRPIRAACFDIDAKREEAPSSVARSLSIQLGDSAGAAFVPKLSIVAWNECSFTIQLPATAGASPKEMLLSGRTGLWLSGEHGTRHEWSVRPDSNFEWEIILDSMPTSCTLAFSVQTANLRFYYQPPLTAAEISAGHERPDSVVGSYAVYHSAASGNITRLTAHDTTRIAYGSGKAFHIYRPHATDASGHSTWCDLNIGTTLSITIPSNFLKSARFPIRIDPTFGYTTAGASSLAMNSARCYANRAAAYRHLAGAGERIDSFRVNWKTYSGNNDTLDIALYSYTTGPQNRLDTAVWTVTASGTPVWTTTAPIHQSLVAGTEYTIATNIRDGAPRLSYDVGSSADHSFDYQTDLPVLWTEDGTGTYLLSAYAYYTVTTAPSASTPARRRRCAGY